MIKSIGKGLLELLAELVALPVWAVARLLMRAPGDADQVFAWTAQAVSLWTGPLGDYARRAVLHHLLERCEKDACICFGTVFSRRGARIGHRAYVGVGCNLGLVDLGDDCLLGSGVHVLSGKNQHHFERTDLPIREQGGTFTRVSVGTGTWIGNAAVLMASVGRDCVIGAGSVVVKDVPDGAMVGGNPARVLGWRAGYGEAEASSAGEGGPA